MHMVNPFSGAFAAVCLHRRLQHRPPGGAAASRGRKVSNALSPSGSSFETENSPNQFSKFRESPSVERLDRLKQNPPPFARALLNNTALRRRRRRRREVRNRILTWVVSPKSRFFVVASTATTPLLFSVVHFTFFRFTPCSLPPSELCSNNDPHHTHIQFRTDTSLGVEAL